MLFYVCIWDNAAIENKSLGDICRTALWKKMSVEPKLSSWVAHHSRLKGMSAQELTGACRIIQHPSSCLS